jgi:hypothetical protein
MQTSRAGPVISRKEDRRLKTRSYDSSSKRLREDAGCCVQVAVWKSALRKERKAGCWSGGGPSQFRMTTAKRPGAI